MSEAARKAAFYKEQAENFAKLASMYEHVGAGGRAIPTEDVEAAEKTATATPEAQVALDNPPTLQEVERRARSEYDAFYKKLDPRVPKHDAPSKTASEAPAGEGRRINLASLIHDAYKQGFIGGFLRGKLGGEISRLYEEQMDEGFTWGKSGRVVLDKVDLAGRGALDETSDVPLDHVDMDAAGLGDIGAKVPTRDEKFFTGPSHAPKKIGSMKELARHLRDSEEEFVKEAETRIRRASPKVAEDIDAEEELLDRTLKG